MTVPMPVDEELVVRIAGGRARKVLVRTPSRVTPGGVLCLNLAMDRTFTLDTAPYNIVTNLFLAAGHRVASLDMPQHGELVDGFGEGLAGMAAAVAAGVDIFADLAAAARALVDEGIRRGWVTPGRVVACGTSRGGHAALCLLAEDDRLLAAAVHAPVTCLPALEEFAALADHPIVRRWNAGALAPRLAGRPVFQHIGEEDPRVGAEHCFALHARLTAAARGGARPVLYTLPGSTHGDAFLEPGYHAAAAFLLAQCADAIKGETGG